jgi:hypothetical protein
MEAAEMKKSLLLLVALLPMVAHADKLALPANAPPAFQAECASCHVAFPPQLLVADDWRRVMRTLDKHYGDNASLDEKTRLAIEDFLARHGGSPSKVGIGAAANKEELPRITATAWFKRKHHEVPRADWTDPKVKTPANCLACHTKAAEGSYREREIVMPNGKKWEN